MQLDTKLEVLPNPRSSSNSSSRAVAAVVIAAITHQSSGGSNNNSNRAAIAAAVTMRIYCISMAGGEEGGREREGEDSNEGRA